jgi:putative colanic acid biosynthesis glycosyltransferase
MLSNSNLMDHEELVSNSKADLPTISVITINRNTRDGLETTIGSVVGQTYPHLEFLIIDGASIDGSFDLIQRFASQIDYWISEPDCGIYDAMNKGVRAATGEWVIFMNSGDRFHDSNAVASVFSECHSDADLVYGHSVLWYAREKFERFVPAESLAALPLRMNCSHQSLFTRRSLLLQRPYSLGFMAADYEFLVRMYVERRRFKTVDRVVSVNVNGGISDVRRIRSVAERARIAARYGLMTPRRALSFVGMGIWAGLGPQLKRVLPQQLTTWILRRRTVD